MKDRSNLPLTSKPPSFLTRYRFTLLILELPDARRSISPLFNGVCYEHSDLLPAAAARGCSIVVSLDVAVPVLLFHPDRQAGLFSGRVQRGVCVVGMGRSVSWGLAAVGLALGFTVVDAHAQSFTGPGITVSGTALESVGSSVSVGGITGTLSSMSLQFNNLNVTNLNNIAVVLVSPDGHALDLLSGLCGENGKTQVNLSTFTLADTNDSGTDNDAGYLPGFDQSDIQQGTCPSAYSGTYLPTDYWAPDFDTFNSPGPSTYSAAGFPGTAGDNFGSAFASSTLNGTWTLYIANQGTASGSLGSWTLTIVTSGGTGASTTTSLSSSASGNETTIGTNVTVTATVTSGGSAVSAGTVAFNDNGNTISGCSAVPVNGSGQAACTSSFSAEGSHPIVATYNPVPGYIGSTSSALNLFIDHATNTPTAGQYCNQGGLSISGSLSGSNNPAVPYPSHIKVSGYSGNISGATLTLNGFSDANPGQTAMLLVGPTGANIVPWLNVGGSTAVNNISFTLADSAGPTNTIPSPPANGDDYYPTAILLGAAPVFPPPAPTPYQFAPPPGDAGQTFTSAFNGINPNGYWSLYLYNSTGSTALSATSWCVNLLSQPALSLSMSHTGTFTQGDAADTYTIAVANNAAATSTELTLSDTLPSGMSAVSFAETGHSGGGTGSDWSCTGTSCTRSSSMPTGEQDTLTLTVGVGYGTSFGTDAVTNSATFSDGTNTANATDPTTISPGAVQVTFNTNPSGLSYSVNGTPFTTQQTQSETNGSNVSLSTTSPQTLSSTDYVWSGWSDGGDISHSATISSTAETATYTANFALGYALTTSANPVGSRSGLAGLRHLWRCRQPHRHAQHGLGFHHLDRRRCQREQRLHHHHHECRAKRHSEFRTQCSDHRLDRQQHRRPQ